MVHIGSRAYTEINLGGGGGQNFKGKFKIFRFLDTFK